MARAGSPMAISPSPPPQQMSKRDKRRKNIVEKLQDMINTFSKDQTQHYRAQLQAIQVDMTLILRADPYENTPLDDDPQHIEELIDALTGGVIPGGKAAKEDFLALAGRRYYEYCQEINKAQEKRDADLTMLKNHYDDAMTELERTNGFKIQVAQREHLELAATIRQRLINTITKKRDRLLREKEQLDIADSNSLLLHPSHFTMNAPSSPGGLHSNRKTRHTRHRMGDGDDNGAERGRKRKAGDEDGNDSPVPGFRPLTQDGSGAFSPFQEQKAKTLKSQQEAPAYSIDSIFTEKELAHATSVAQYATHHFFHQQQPNEQQASNGQTNGKPSSSTTQDGPADALNALAGTAENAERAPSPPPTQPEASGMERQVSNYATRGATRANPLSFLSDAAMAVSNDLSMVNPFIPNMIPITKTDKGAPTPPGASIRDIHHDMECMLGDDDEPVSSRWMARPPLDERGIPQSDRTVAEARAMYLEQACKETTASQPFRVPLTDIGPAMIGEGVNRPAAIGFADPASIPNGARDGVTSNALAAAGFSHFAAAYGGGVPMSRATSLGGSEMGAGDFGGVGMRRTRSRAV